MFNLRIWILGWLASGWLIPCSLLGQVANRSGHDSTIFISSTVFVPKYPYRSGEQNWDVATADMDRDGHLDILTASKLDGQVHVHYNDGAGNFARSASYPAQRDHRGLCTFDANGDGWPDVATVSLKGKLCVLMNDGRGGLGQLQVLKTGIMAHDVATADLNGDGHADLLVAAVTTHALHPYWGDGKGHFTPGPLLPTGRGPRAVCIADLDRDGQPDLIAGCDDGRIYLHYGLGQGRFAPPRAERSGAANWALGVADINGDGLLDLVTASYMDKKLCLHLQTETGTFVLSQELISGDHNCSLVIGDFDLDGDLDVITASTVDHAVSFHLNDGRGKLGERLEIKSGAWNVGIAVGDFDGDGDPDFVTSSVNDHAINVHRNTSAKEPAREGPRTTCVFGKVYNDDTQHIIPEAPISLQTAHGTTVSTQLTGENGSYRFCPKPGKGYLLIVRAPGLPVYRETFDMPDSDLEKDIYLSLPKGAFVYGKVRDAKTLIALPDAEVMLRTSEGEVMAQLEVKADGSYRYELPFGTNYGLEGAEAGYQPVNHYFDVEERHVGRGVRVNLDLPRIEAPTEACLCGRVRDGKTGRPLAGAGVLVKDASGRKFRKFNVDESGAYELCLPFGNYEFTAQAKGYFFFVDEVEVRLEDLKDCRPYDLPLQPLEKDAQLVLEHIYFDVDKAILREASVAELERLVDIMRQNPSLVVEIAGHTDSDATEGYNLNLSQRRSQAVVDFLSASGIEFHRMQAQGYGESQPVAPNDSPTNKQLNRRTEFRVIGFEE
jgi:outer membrane protein OmpA-like peptidoglycan-associated protein